MLLKYREHEFKFVPLSDDLLIGRFILTPVEQKLLRALLEAEAEDNSEAQAGEKPSPEQLFARSPWSFNGPTGPVKIINRYINLETGEAIFSQAPANAGEMFAWPKP